jgi:hypothetical protein
MLELFIYMNIIKVNICTSAANTFCILLMQANKVADSRLWSESWEVFTSLGFFLFSFHQKAKNEEFSQLISTGRL